MRILVLDNYDSFTYNLVHYIEQLIPEQVEVFRNDKISLDEIAVYDKILLSPGPGIPEEAGILIKLIQMYGHEKDILGVCLGHQAIAEALGGTLINLDRVFHGLATPMNIIEDDIIFKGIVSPFTAGRYHSWIVNENDLPKELIVTARDEDGNIMAMKHKNFKLRGVQFHPESVLTPDGLKMIENWINLNPFQN